LEEIKWDRICEDLELPGARIVLLDSSDKAYRDENLFCYRPDGSLRWKARLPAGSGPDCFVAVTLDGSAVCANTWSGFALWLDPDTGRTLRQAFTK
jgi:outer membrane protein assembly factor BamB